MSETLFLDLEARVNHDDDEPEMDEDISNELGGLTFPRVYSISYTHIGQFLEESEEIDGSESEDIERSLFRGRNKSDREQDNEIEDIVAGIRQRHRQ